MTQLGVDGQVVGESRAPMAIAVTVLIAATLLPPYIVPVLPVLVAGLEGLLLVTLLVVDPGRIDDRSRRARRISVALIGLLVATTLLGTFVLVADLVLGGPETNDAALLLLTGAKVWLANNVAFALAYWEFDRGGPVERAFGTERPADFAFPQDLNPDIAAPGWRPRFLDYLYVAFTNATAFSPTDTMPLSHWAKVAMGSQGLISLVILGLVIARAVNIFK